MNSQSIGIKNYINNKYVKYIFIVLLASVFYYTILNLISIKGIIPDLFLLIIIWITLKEGRLTGMLAGFIIGLYLDIISADTIGTNALTKTIAAFIASYFYKENSIKKITASYKFMFIVLFSTLIHNLIYFFLFIKTNEQDFILSYMQYGLATAAYTTSFSAFVFLFQLSSNRKQYY